MLDFANSRITIRHMEYKDYYKILGVERKASADDIRKRYDVHTTAALASLATFQPRAGPPASVRVTFRDEAGRAVGRHGDRGRGAVRRLRESGRPEPKGQDEQEGESGDLHNNSFSRCTWLRGAARSSRSRISISHAPASRR